MFNVVKPGRQLPRYRYKGVCGSCGCEFFCNVEDTVGVTMNAKCPNASCASPVPVVYAGTEETDSGVRLPLGGSSALVDRLRRARVVGVTDSKTVRQVLSERHHGVTGGCCDRYADMSGCDCLERCVDFEDWDRCGRPSSVCVCTVCGGFH